MYTYLLILHVLYDDIDCVFIQYILYLQEVIDNTNVSYIYLQFNTGGSWP